MLGDVCRFWGKLYQLWAMSANLGATLTIWRTWPILARRRRILSTVCRWGISRPAPPTPKGPALRLGCREGVERCLGSTGKTWGRINSGGLSGACLGLLRFREGPIAPLSCNRHVVWPATAHRYDPHRVSVFFVVAAGAPHLRSYKNGAGSSPHTARQALLVCLAQIS